MNELLTSGRFGTGCNYWASHAGTAMWHDWNPETIERDFRCLAEYGLTYLRVFPLWPDFQPLHRLYGVRNKQVELRFGEEPLPDTPAGRAGVDETMMERFSFLADCAEKSGLRLIVGLVTGWMSGRMFAPPAFAETNVLTGHEAIRWQVRFVRCFVSRMAAHPAILAWDLGNECNCMGTVENSGDAWNWTNSIAAAIRLEDNSHPVVSGMHGLKVESSAPWRIADQAELTDVLTTHPYPLFTPHCNRERLNSIRSILHSTAESCLYSDIGDRPCLVEELGSFGPPFAGDKVAAKYLKAVLFSCWAHDLRGLLWWCGFDQDQLAHPPYDWFSMERELGLFTTDCRAKPVAQVLKEFAAFTGRPDIGPLPPRRTDAVCLLTKGQDNWGAAFGAFILSKQAGFDIEFRDATGTLPDSDIYLMPSISLMQVLPRHRWLELIGRVKNGARLFVSSDNGVLQPFNELFGVDIEYSCREPRETAFRIEEIEHEFRMHVEWRQPLEALKAGVLGRDGGGRPVFTRCKCGQGELFYLNLPMEQWLVETPGAFYGASAQPFYKIYELFFRMAGGRRVIAKSHPDVGITEHFTDERTMIAVIINYNPEAVEPQLSFSDGWRLDSVLYGGSGLIAGNDAAVIKLVKFL